MGLLTKYGVIQPNPFFDAISENANIVSNLGRSMVGATDFSDFARRASEGYAPARQSDQLAQAEVIKEQRRLADLDRQERMKQDALDFVTRRGGADAERLTAGIKSGALEAAEAFKTDTSDKFDEYGLSKTGAKSQQMKLLIQQGVPEDDALGIVSGRYKIHTDPSTGRTSKVDMVTNQLVPFELPIDTAQSAAPSAELPTGDFQGGGRQEGLYDQAGDATGVSSTVSNVLTNTLGQLPGDLGRAFTNEEAARADAEFQLFKRDLIRSLSLNPRFPVAEQQRIENLIPRGAIVSETKLKLALESLDAELARLEQQTIATLSQPNQNLEERAADLQSLRALRAARERLAVPQQGGAGDLYDKYGLER